MWNIRVVIDCEPPSHQFHVSFSLRLKKYLSMKHIMQHSLFCVKYEVRLKKQFSTYKVIQEIKLEA